MAYETQLSQEYLHDHVRCLNHYVITLILKKADDIAAILNIY